MYDRGFKRLIFFFQIRLSVYRLRSGSAYSAYSNELELLIYITLVLSNGKGPVTRDKRTQDTVSLTRSRVATGINSLGT